jgi:hypothetical protein
MNCTRANLGERKPSQRRSASGFGVEQGTPMLDPERCRGTASRYAKLATLADRALVRQACRNLERLWLELADMTEEPDADRSAIQKRRDVLMANIDSQRRLTSH